MPITLPKDSALYTAPPAKIGASSPVDVAGTDYGVSAFTSKPIVATSSASRIDTGANSVKLDTKIADQQTSSETKATTDALAPEKLEPARDTASGGVGGTGYQFVGLNSEY